MWKMKSKKLFYHKLWEKGGIATLFETLKVIWSNYAGNNQHVTETIFAIKFENITRTQF